MRNGGLKNLVCNLRMKLVVFDLDGVLVDIYSLYYHQINNNGYNSPHSKLLPIFCFKFCNSLGHDYFAPTVFLADSKSPRRAKYEAALASPIASNNW